MLKKFQNIKIRKNPKKTIESPKPKKENLDASSPADKALLEKIRKLESQTNETAPKETEKPQKETHDIKKPAQDTGTIKKPIQASNTKNTALRLGKSSSLINKIKKSFSSTPKNKKSRLVFELKNLTIEDFDSYEIMHSYDVGACRVYIAKSKEGKVHYLIAEPPIDNIGKAIYTKLMHFLYISLSSEFKEKKDAQDLIRAKIFELSRELGIYKHTARIINSLLYYIIRDSFGYGMIDAPMNDPNLEDIVEENFTKPVGVVHKKFGEYGILDTNIKFSSTEAANSFVQKLVQRTGKSLTAAVPYIDSMTKDGHRIAATFGNEVSLPGANFTIRKFSDEPYTITKLIEMGTLNPLMAAYLWILLDSKAFVLVIGSTAAGKTTTIGAISSLINPQMKIITIEDTPELRLGHTHWQRLITRKSTSLFEDKYEVTMDDLVRLSLRSRPDFIVVGEVRGKEISSLIQAVSTGHGGLTSFHATDASSTLVRMESPPMNVHLSGQMLISIILRQNRLVDSEGHISRRITEITEVIPEQNKIRLKTVMGWDATKKEFYPPDLQDLVANSVRLKEIAQINGWSQDEILNQLVTRVCFLSSMLQNNYKDFDAAIRELAKFYYDPIQRSISILNTKSLGEFSYAKISAK
ncbi:MAG: type II/IV secretion system ATPase subunit [Nitrososphaerota archaeon]